MTETCEWCKFAGKRNCDKKERGKNAVRCADYKLSNYAKMWNTWNNGRI